jgi:hypothetical protein
MAWSVVSSANRTANVGQPASTSWNAGTLGAAVSANDVLIGLSSINHATTLLTVDTITDSLSNVWTKVLSVNGSGSGAAMELAWWVAVSSAGTPSNITLGISSNPTSMGLGFSVQAYRGLSTASGSGGVDISKLAAVGTDVFDSGTTAASTAAANELKLGGYIDWGSSGTITAGTSDTTYTKRVDGGGNGNAITVIEDADSGASGSTARATVSNSSASNLTDMAVMVYALAGGAPAATSLVMPHNPLAAMLGR